MANSLQFRLFDSWTLPTEMQSKFFFSPSLFFHLEEEQLPSQPSNSIRELALQIQSHKALWNHAFSWASYTTTCRVKTLCFSICTFELEVYSDFSQTAITAICSPTFPSSFFMLFIRIGKADIWNSKTEHLAVMHYSIRLQLLLACSARRSELEARQTHTFRLSSAAYCMLLLCGIGQPRCSPRGKAACCFTAIGDTHCNMLKLHLTSGQRILFSCIAVGNDKSHRLPVMIIVCSEVPELAATNSSITVS